MDDGVEPTYPYCRLLLRFDAAALLLALDFRGFIFHRESERRHKPALHRQDTARALASSSLPSLSPQSIQTAPSVMHNILAGMNRSTREDCQLATDCLLLGYSPHETEQQLRLFQGFHRILRMWHHHEGRWAPLLLAHIHCPDIHPPSCSRTQTKFSLSRPGYILVLCRTASRLRSQPRFPAFCMSASSTRPDF